MKKYVVAAYVDGEFSVTFHKANSRHEAHNLYDPLHPVESDEDLDMQMVGWSDDSYEIYIEEIPTDF